MKRSSSWPAAKRCDLFCRVVDNFGDIGVCARLAKILVDQYDISVRLITDRPELLRCIAPQSIDRRKSSQSADLELVRWSSNEDLAADAGLVIEAFACELPDAYAQRMAGQAVPPLWINLEYLSAEAWISGCHGMPSVHPRLGLTKYFFFPGFDQTSGGLLREADLLARREDFLASPGERAAHWAGLGAADAERFDRRISLFGYENPAVSELLECLANSAISTLLLVPEGRSVAEVATWFGAVEAQPGRRWRRGPLSAQVIPFTDQDGYDRLLWNSDMNLVRGEDSLVRALWAGRPLLWQLYRQPEDAQLAKLEAFLSRALQVFDHGPVGEAYARTLRAWNLGLGLESAWPDFELGFKSIGSAFGRWQRVLAGGPELAESLVKFFALKLK